MEVVARVDAELDPAELFEVIADLGTYPEWLDIVSLATPSEPAPDGLDPGPAWSIDLRGQLGPLRRSKRLRMVRVAHEPGTSVRFERREVDGRRHSSWVLSASIDATSGRGCSLGMTLHYGGSLWVPMLDRVLRDEIERSRPRLVEFVSAR